MSHTRIQTDSIVGSELNVLMKRPDITLKLRIISQVYWLLSLIKTEISGIKELVPRTVDAGNVRPEMQEPTETASICVLHLYSWPQNACCGWSYQVV